MRSDLGDLLREARFAAGLLGALWLACYLYELGFLARFGVPVGLAEIGFSRPLCIALVAGPLGALLAALLLWRCGGLCSAARDRLFTALCLLLALAAAGAAVLIEDPVPILLAADFDFGFNPVRLVLFFCLILYAALLFARYRRFLREGEPGRVVQSSLLLLALIAAPVALGWHGAGNKAENRRSFLYLVERPDYVLVRLYDDKAVFVRYDKRTGRFGSDWLVHGFDDPQSAYVTLRPANG